jgi:hypothetical protein
MTRHSYVTRCDPVYQNVTKWHNWFWMWASWLKCDQVTIFVLDVNQLTKMWPVKQNVTRCDQVTKLVLYLYQFTKMWTVIQNVTRFDPCHKIGIGCETVDQNVTNQTKCYQSNNKEIESDGVDQNVTSSCDLVNKIVITYKTVNQNVTKWQNWD